MIQHIVFLVVINLMKLLNYLLNHLMLLILYNNLMQDLN